MYRKIFRAISPKEDYRNVSSKKPPVFAFEAWLATLPVCQVLQQFGPCAEPFQPAVHDFRVRGYQGISGTGKSGLCKPPVTGLVETFWMETAKLKCGSAIVQWKKKVPGRTNPWNEFSIRKSRNQRLFLWDDSIGPFQMGCNCFQGSQPGDLHLCRASCDLEQIFGVGI